MRGPQVFDIDGVRYTITAMDPEAEGLPVFIRLTKLVGAALGTSIEGNDVSGLADMDTDSIDLGAGIKELVNRLDEREALATIKTMLDGRYISYQGPTKDEGGALDMAHFTGDYGRMFKVLGKVLEVNYGRFLSVFIDGLKKAISKAPSGEPKKKKAKKDLTRA